MISENMAYENSISKRPPEIDKGGRGTYCCVPKCGNSSYDRNMQPTKIGLFRFPNEKKRPDQRKLWVAALKRFRRKGGNDSFKIKESTRVCEFHFKPAEIRVSRGIGRKTYVKGAVPSIFKFKKDRSPKKKRKSPTKRSLSPIEETSESEYEDDDIGVILPLGDESGQNSIDSLGKLKFDNLVLLFCCPQGPHTRCAFRFHHKAVR